MPQFSMTHLALLGGYGVAFTLLRSASSHWAGHQLFSVWFPAAGLRFALLWIIGPRWAPAAAIAELVVSVGAGTVALGSEPALALFGVVGPGLVYGAIIAIVQRRMRRHSDDDEFDPLAFAIAAILGPMAACIAALPWAVPLSIQRGTIDPSLLLSALLVFTVGDLLGILILVPPLLWLAHGIGKGEWSVPLHGRGTIRFLELALLLSCAWALVWLMQRLGDGLVLAPALLAASWCGLRGGRLLAWAAILVCTLIVLPITAHGPSDAVRVQVHMQLACIAVGAYLAGSYADAQARAVVEIGRRDRILLHAERLKTLRAMSVAVIHELSQPLSTIAIESAALLDLTKGEAPDAQEVRVIAALIARKSNELAELIRRLRVFGSGSNETRTLHDLRQLVYDVISLADPEARIANVILACTEGPDLKAKVHDVEIRQAMLNLVRNAIAAAPGAGSVVKLGWSRAGSFVEFSVENEVRGDRPRQKGMGLGLIISRTIAQAHGGRVAVTNVTGDRVRSTLHVPLHEGPSE